MDNDRQLDAAAAGADELVEEVDLSDEPDFSDDDEDEDDSDPFVELPDVDELLPDSRLSVR
ncbi:hypothetical protein ASJ79_29115 [Mycobacterium sp. NAZ190054]|nr:hypothetical protein ASJ79_29115 [Mycobacterium sp. NAZ190054]